MHAHLGHVPSHYASTTRVPCPPRSHAMHPCAALPHVRPHAPTTCTTLCRSYVDAVLCHASHWQNPEWTHPTSAKSTAYVVYIRAPSIQRHTCHVVSSGSQYMQWQPLGAVCPWRPPYTCMYTCKPCSCTCEGSILGNLSCSVGGATPCLWVSPNHKWNTHCITSFTLRQIQWLVNSRLHSEIIFSIHNSWT